MLFEGILVNGQVVLDTVPQLPDGSRVVVQVTEAPSKKSQPAAAATTSDRRGYSAEEVMKMFAPVTPAPSEEVCRQILIDELSKKHLQ